MSRYYTKRRQVLQETLQSIYLRNILPPTEQQNVMNRTTLKYVTEATATATPFYRTNFSLHLMGKNV